MTIFKSTKFKDTKLKKTEFKKSTIIMFALGMFVSAQAMAATKSEGPFVIGQLDKRVHIATAYGVSLTETALLVRHTQMNRWTAVLISSATVLVLGLAKESLVDSVFSTNDMIANGIGVALNGFVIWAGDLFPSRSGKTKTNKAKSTSEGEDVMSQGFQ